MFSFDGAVQAILDNLDPLISPLISDSDNNPIAKGILNIMTTFQFLVTTHFFADTLPVLSQLSKRLRQCVDFTAVSEDVQVTISAWKALSKHLGPGFKSLQVRYLLNSVKNSTAKISDIQAQHQGFVVRKERFNHKLIENLQSRFPDSGLLSAF